MNKLFTFGGGKYTFVKPYYLMSGIKLIKATVKGSTMVWNIKGGEVSYNQIKRITGNSDKRVKR